LSLEMVITFLNVFYYGIFHTIFKTKQKSFYLRLHNKRRFKFALFVLLISYSQNSHTNVRYLLVLTLFRTFILQSYIIPLEISSLFLQHVTWDVDCKVIKLFNKFYFFYPIKHLKQSLFNLRCVIHTAH
jgi:hypothetical protein